MFKLKKVGWLDEGRRGLHEGGGTVSNTLKGGGTKMRGGETKVLKRGQAGSRGGCLKKVHWEALTNCLVETEI